MVLPERPPDTHPPPHKVVPPLKGTVLTKPARDGGVPSLLPDAGVGRIRNGFGQALTGLAGRAQLVPPIVGDDRSPSPAHLAAHGPLQVGARDCAGSSVGPVSHLRVLLRG
jgi:hypothetical protein